MIFKEHAKLRSAGCFCGFSSVRAGIALGGQDNWMEEPRSQWFETKSKCIKGHWRNSDFILKATEFESYEQRHNLISHFNALNQLFINGKYYGFLDWGH